MKKLYQFILSHLLIVTMMFLLISNSFAQTVNMPAGTVTYAGGVPFGSTINFYDNGGSAGAYTNNFNGTYTFCPQTAGDVICITFSTFNTELNYDFIYLYSGTTATGQVMNGVLTSGNGVLNGLTFVSTTADGCITIRFTTDGVTTRPGWAATVTANKRCKTVTASQTGSNVYVCPAAALNPGSLVVSVNGSASSATAPQIIDQWVWDWGDGTSSTTATGSTSHTFSSTPGVHVVNLIANDNSPATCVIPAIGCASSNPSARTVYVLPAPDTISQSKALQKICKGLTAPINAQVRSVSVQNKREDPNPGVLFLPDGAGVSYNSQVQLKSFPFGSTVTAACMPYIIVCIEHDYVNDLSMEIIAPDGKSAYLMNRNSANPSASLGLCSPTSSVLGQCACYTFVTSAAKSLTQQAASATIPIDNACAGGFLNTNAAIPPGTYRASNNAAGTTPAANALNSLLGAPINGTWTLRITDNQGVNDGYICDWDIIFPDPCYGLQDITANILGGNWTGAGTNPAVVTLNASKTDVACIPTGSTCAVNDGVNNSDNPGLPLYIDPNGNTITNNQSPVFNTPGLYSFDFDYSDDTPSSCDYKLIKTIKVYDVPDVTSLSCNATGPSTMDVAGVPSIDNSNFTGADIGQWEYSIDGGATWQSSVSFSGITPGNTYNVSVRNKAYPTCTATKAATVAVPVELLSFTAGWEKEKVLLHWETASELNSSHFMVERSADGISFSTLGRVESAINSNTVKDYNFYDKAPLKGLAYYRLMQVDKNAKINYSIVIPVENLQSIGDKGITTIKPNPLPNGVSVLDMVYVSEKVTEATVVVRSMTGQELYKKQVLLKKGENSLKVSIADIELSSGTYFIQVNTPGGIDAKRFIVETR